MPTGGRLVSSGEVSEAAFVRELRDIEVPVTEHALSPLNALGIKSVGQGGVNGLGAAIIAAGGVIRLL